MPSAHTGILAPSGWGRPRTRRTCSCESLEAHAALQNCVSLLVNVISLRKIAALRAVASLTALIAVSMVRGSGCARACSAPPTPFSEGGNDADEEEGRTEDEEGREAVDEEKGLEEVGRLVRAASSEAAPRSAAR